MPSLRSERPVATTVSCAKEGEEHRKKSVPASVRFEIWLLAPGQFEIRSLAFEYRDPLPEFGPERVRVTKFRGKDGSLIPSVMTTRKPEPSGEIRTEPGPGVDRPLVTGPVLRQHP
jgi:hypothetical protein